MISGANQPLDLQGQILLLRLPHRGINEPRKPKGVRHPLPAVLALAVCAMLSGGRSLYAIAQWGREHPQLAQSLGFSLEQTPCVATLHHVFRRLEVDACGDHAFKRPARTKTLPVCRICKHS